MGLAAFTTVMTPSRAILIASRSTETVPTCRGTTPGQARPGVKIQIPLATQLSTTEAIRAVIRGVQLASLLVVSSTVTNLGY